MVHWDRIVYRPVTTGVPTIDVEPMTSGIARAASVMPATTSTGARARSTGRTPCSSANR
jgi:hypothetical protein